MVLSVPAFLFTQANNLDAQFGNGATKAWPVRGQLAASVIGWANGRKSLTGWIVRLVERRGEWRRVLPDQEAVDVIRVDLDDYVDMRSAVDTRECWLFAGSGAGQRWNQA